MTIRALCRTRRVDSVLDEVLRLHEARDVLDRRPNVPADRDLVKRHDHRLSSGFAVRARREQVAELGVGKLVHET